MSFSTYYAEILASDEQADELNTLYLERKRQAILGLENDSD